MNTYLKSRWDGNNKIYLFNNKTGITALLGDNILDLFEEYINNNKKTLFIQRIINMGLLPEKLSLENKNELINNINKSRIKRDEIYYTAPEALHIDLLTNCPLNCPKCYRNPQDEKILPLRKLNEYLDEGNKIGVFQIAFGGGEPLLYPHLEEAVKKVSSYYMSSSITTSGFGLTDEKIDSLIESGLNHIQISLNGSSKKINSFTRDGYEEGIKALEILKNKKISYGINWVANKSNLDDFKNMIELGKYYLINNINILRYKGKNSEDNEKYSLTKEEDIRLAKYIRKYQKDINIKTDSAYSKLILFLNNTDIDMEKIGCGAGITFMSINVNGKFKPCSHLPIEEETKTIEEYWTNSKELHSFRENYKNLGGSCKTCTHKNYCKSCPAINISNKNDISSGEKDCVGYYKEENYV